MTDTEVVIPLSLLMQTNTQFQCDFDFLFSITLLESFLTRETLQLDKQSGQDELEQVGEFFPLQNSPA